MTLNLDRTNQMRDALDSLLSETALIINASDHVPAKNSLAEKELNFFKRQISVKAAQDQSYLLLESSADYLSCLIKSLTEPVESIAPWSLARGVMECAAYSIWIGRPDITVNERVKRSLAFRLRGIQEQSRLSKNAPELIQPIDNSYNNLINIAHEIGIEVKINKEGIPTKIGTHLPNSTDLCESELGESIVYRILSSATHSQPFAIQQLSFKQIGASKTDNDRIDTVKHLSNESVGFICSFAGRSFLRALSARLKYYGYLPAEVVKILKKRSDDILLTDEEFRYCIWS